MSVNKEDSKILFDKKSSLFMRACNNTKEALSIFFNENNVPFLAITTRVKSFDSFFEKIERKNYQEPFTETEDFCGVRIILYNINDIKKVNEVINREFDVQNDEDKSEKLEVNEFGYRSHHFIVKIKREWLNTPNYRGLEDVKIEIQVRTVLMHAWAEIEHKLGYKNKEQVPKELRRKLFFISAKLEEADEQFKDLTNEIVTYSNNLISKAVENGKFSSDELNINTLEALLDYYFPDYEKYSKGAEGLLKEIEQSGISIATLVELAERIKPIASYVNELINPKNPLRRTNQPNLMSYAIQAYHPKGSSTGGSQNRLRIIEAIRQKSK